MNVGGNHGYNEEKIGPLYRLCSLNSKPELKLKQALNSSEYAVIMQLNIRPYGIPFDYATAYSH
jgi:hypothetical protein